MLTYIAKFYTHGRLVYTSERFKAENDTEAQKSAEDRILTGEVEATKCYIMRIPQSLSKRRLKHEV